MLWALYMTMGGQIKYGGILFWRLRLMNTVVSANCPVPNNQCGLPVSVILGAGVTKWLSEEVLGINNFTVLRHLILSSLGRPHQCFRKTQPLGDISVSFDVSLEIVRYLRLRDVGRIVFKSGKGITSITVNGSLVWMAHFIPLQVLWSIPGFSVRLPYWCAARTYSIVATYSGTYTPVFRTGRVLSCHCIGIDSITSGNWGGFTEKMAMYSVIITKTAMIRILAVICLFCQLLQGKGQWQPSIWSGNQIPMIVGRWPWWATTFQNLRVYFAMDGTDGILLLSPLP